MDYSNLPNIEIRLKDISISYKNKLILKEINLRINQNSKIVLLGHSGSGKSTLLNTIMGMQIIHEGTLTQSNNVKPILLSHKSILLNWLNLFENVKLYSKASDIAIKDMLSALSIHSSLSDFPHQLSRGITQRANVACALLSKANILLLDEPFSNLDILTKQKNYAYISNVLKEEKLGYVLVTHDIEEALFFGRTIYFLGGTPSSLVNVYNNPCTFITNKESSNYLVHKQHIKKIINTIGG